MDTYVNILEALSTIIQPGVTDGTTVLHRAEHFTTTNTSRPAKHRHSTHTIEWLSSNTNSDGRL